MKKFMLRNEARGDISVQNQESISAGWDTSYSNDPDEEMTLGEWMEVADTGDTYRHEEDSVRFTCIGYEEAPVTKTTDDRLYSAGPNAIRNYLREAASYDSAHHKQYYIIKALELLDPQWLVENKDTIEQGTPG